MLGSMTPQLWIALRIQKVTDAFSQINAVINKEFPQFVKIFLDMA